MCRRHGGSTEPFGAVVVRAVVQVVFFFYCSEVVSGSGSVVAERPFAGHGRVMFVVSTIEADEQDFSELAADGAFVLQTVTQMTGGNRERDTRSISSLKGARPSFERNLDGRL